MSKPEKFLSIGISILKAQGEKPGCDAKQLWRMIRQARNLLEERGILYPGKAMQERRIGTLHVTVADEKGLPTPCLLYTSPSPRD